MAKINKQKFIESSPKEAFKFKEKRTKLLKITNENGDVLSDEQLENLGLVNAKL